jgi:dihydrofolate reductase
MSIVTADMMVSLDGFIAGPDPSDPADRGIELHRWIAELASWRKRQGLQGGKNNIDSDVVGEWFDATGAVVMGRKMYDDGEAAWGGNPPFQTPVFVLTSRARPALVTDDGMTITFVTDGIRSALEQARAAAGERNVDVSGGANTVQQFLRAGLLDELQLHVVPVLLHAGIRLFDHLGEGLTRLERIRVVDGPGATHLRYRTLS